MTDFTLNAPGTTNNPWTPANIIVPVSTIQSNASAPNGFRAGSGAYAAFAHNVNYGSTITITVTYAAISGNDKIIVGAVVRSGANAGAIIGINLDGFGNVGAVTTSPAGISSFISTNGSLPAGPVVGDVYSVTIAISGGTATITATQNGTGITFSANTTTTYATETTLAAGGGFDPQNNNGTYLSQMTGTGVAAGGASAKLLSMINNQAGF